jgi:hypothetical protein
MSPTPQPYMATADLLTHEAWETRSTFFSVRMHHTTHRNVTRGHTPGGHASREPHTDSAEYMPIRDRGDYIRRCAQARRHVHLAHTGGIYSVVVHLYQLVGREVGSACLPQVEDEAWRDALVVQLDEILDAQRVQSCRARRSSAQRRVGNSDTVYWCPVSPFW